MHWPQYWMLAMMLLTLCGNVVKSARNEKLPSWAVSVVALVVLGALAWNAYVLHAGGFW